MNNLEQITKGEGDTAINMGPLESHLHKIGFHACD